MFTLSRAVLSVTAVAWLGGSAIAQSQSNLPANGPPPDGAQKAVLYDSAADAGAFAISYPAGWHYQATLWQGTPCYSMPVPVFRITSPDGLTMAEQMPPFAWNWGSNPATSQSKPGCMDVHQMVSARDFVKYIASMLQVDYVAEDPVPDKDTARSQENFGWLNVQSDHKAGNGKLRTRQWADRAMAKVRFRNGTYIMEGRLAATTRCVGTRFSDSRGHPAEADACVATVRYVYSPTDQFATMWPVSQRIVSQPIAGYVEAWRAAMQHGTQANITQMDDASQTVTAASQQSLAHQQAARQLAHNQFLATMQAGTDASLQHAAQIANTRHAIAWDYVDYALGQKTYRNPATGQVTVFAPGIGVIWRTPDGTDSYQTPDLNANPNGVLPGTWNRGQQTHGDGSPYP